MPIVEDYTRLITSEYEDQPLYVQTVALRVQPYVDMMNLLEGMPALFDLDTAVGDQLDKTGQWIGLTRYLDVPFTGVYFSWDDPTVGWDQGVWFTTNSTTFGVAALDDDHYRILLKARVVANQWDGTIPGAYEAWNTLFEPEGYQILIQDGLPAGVPYFTWDDSTLGWDRSEWITDDPAPVNGDMDVIIGLIAPTYVQAVDAITRALLTGSYLDPVSAGVEVKAYALQSVIGRPMFGFNAGPTPVGTDFMAWDTQALGWDQGVWDDTPPGYIAPPKLNYFAWNAGIGWDQGVWDATPPPLPTYAPLNPPTAPPTSMAGWDFGCWAELIPGS